VKTAPPPGRSPAWISPPCWRTIFFTIASPRPVPPCLVVKYGSKIRSRRARSMPGPSSPTVSTARSLVRATPRWMCARAGRTASAAFAQRFASTRRMRARSSATGVAPLAFTTSTSAPSRTCGLVRRKSSTNSPRSAGSGFTSGSLAKPENSSTSRCSVPISSRTISPASPRRRANSGSRSFAGEDRQRASSCWNASFIGVSGFLISWARRRATSCQPEIFSRYTMRSRLSRTSRTISLKAWASSATSSEACPGSTCTARSPPASRCTAWTRRETRRVVRRASTIPIPAATMAMPTRSAPKART
jgi:hypothetical protein